MVLQTKHAAHYANQLLLDLGEDENVTGLADHPAVAWKRSGLLGVTGLMCPLPLASHADGALMALKAISSQPEKLPQSGALLLGERARMRGLSRVGNENPGGSARIIDAKDGRLAINLSRDEDWDLLPAWLEASVVTWDDIERHVKERSAIDLLERGAEMGLAISLEQVTPNPSNWFSLQRFETSEINNRPLIVDLSGLWAGPLSTNLLSLTGADVIKVESPNRPDGLRRGHAGFYAALNSGKDCVALDFSNPVDLGRLKKLLDRADVVIETSRPRAFEQLGLIAEEFVAQKPGKIWVRLTAYGRENNRIGFGDDIGVSAGLSAIMKQAHGTSCFVGDAIADPLTGLHLALAIRALLNQGGGAVIDISMVDVVRYAMGDLDHDWQKIVIEWSSIATANQSPLYDLREVFGDVHELGKDNEKWLR